MDREQSLAERRTSAVPRGVASAFSISVDRALNTEIWDEDGKRYIDFVGGIAVLNVGHCHPRVVEAAQQQAARYMHPAFQVQPYEPYIRLAERLNALAPGAGPKKTLFLSTGAEAVENAVKIARSHTGRPGVVTFTGGFHGRTLLTMGMTGKVVPYKASFGPFPAGIYRIPYPMEYRGVSSEDSIAALHHLFKVEVSSSDVAAIVLESVLGEGGYYQAPREFLEELRKVCDAEGILLVSDEIQAGFGRTGKWFGIEHTGVEPDLLTVAKSLAGGMPLSGVIGKAEVMDAPAPGGLGGTYGGNPVACAAALAVLDVIEEEGLLERANVIGRRFSEWGCDAMGSYPCIGDVRGPGAMLAVELVKDRETREPDAALTNRVREIALENGLLLLSCGLHGNVLRIMVPLTVSDSVLEEGIEILERSIREAAQGS